MNIYTDIDKIMWTKHSSKFASPNCIMWIFLVMALEILRKFMAANFQV